MGFSPLDRRLRLARTAWSEHLVQEAARLVATSGSYASAAETLSRWTGVTVTPTTLWRRTTETAEAVQTVLEAEAAAVMAPPSVGEAPQAERLAADRPLREAANVSIDGVKLLTRESGGREIKLVAVSRVTTERVTGQRGERDGVRLSQHSYRAKLVELAGFEAVVSAEVARRRVPGARQVTSVNDGGEGLMGLIGTVLPQATQVLDWSPGMGHIWKAGHAAFGEGTTAATAWVKARETELWQGQVAAVQRALEDLPPKSGEAGEKLRQVRSYVAEQAARLDYARFRAEGRPIGSGTVESAARNVIKWRMARGGARWGEAYVNPMVALLGEIHSGRYDQTCLRAQALKRAT